MSNTFGNIFKLTTFGESHGNAIGGIIDGICFVMCGVVFGFASLAMSTRFRRSMNSSSYVT